VAFAQLTYRESLRDIETCLSVHASKLYHMGFRRPVRRSTLADANEGRGWRIYAELAQRLITQARKLFADEEPGLDLAKTVYALDSTTIRSTGIICEQTISLDGIYTGQDYPELLRRIRFKDPESGKTLVFITNNLKAPGKWNSSSSGSSSIFGSSSSTARRKTR
jgi:hypothetical protein